MTEWACKTRHRPEPPASVRAQRPPLAAETRSAFGQTNENSCPEHSRRVGAQNIWLAHIEAGRIEVK